MSESDEVVNSISKVSLSEDMDSKVKTEDSAEMDTDDNAPIDNADDSLLHPNDDSTPADKEKAPEINDKEKAPEINVVVRFFLANSDALDQVRPFLDSSSMYNIHKDIKKSTLSVKLVYKTLNYKENVKAIKELLINGSPVERLDIVGVPVDPPAQVIVMNIPESTTEDLLHALFSEATKITMPKTGDGRSKGCAMLLFPSMSDAEECMKQNEGVKIEEQSLVMEVKILPVPAPEQKLDCQVVVTNLPESVTENMLDETFLGHIRLTLPKTKDGKSKGIAMVVFPSRSIAEQFLKANEGLEIEDSVIQMEIKSRPGTPRKPDQPGIGQGRKGKGGRGQGGRRGQQQQQQQQQNYVNGAPKRTNNSNTLEQGTTKKARMDSGSDQRQGGGDPADVANRMANEMAAKMEVMQQRMTERIISQVTSKMGGGSGGGGRSAQSLMSVESKPAQSKKSSVKCFKCGKTGHAANQCRQSTGARGGRGKGGNYNSNNSSPRGNTGQSSYRDNRNRDARRDIGILGVPRYDDYSTTALGRGLLGGYQGGYQSTTSSSDNYLRGLNTRPYSSLDYTY